MPAIFASTSALAQLRSLAQRNDPMASAIMALLDNTYYVALTAATEGSDSITVTGQVTDQDGQDVAGVKNVLIQSIPIAGTGLLTDGGDGTVKAGSGTKEIWIETTAAGKFQVAVANAEVEANLIIATLDNGTVEMLKLSFAA